MTGQERIDRMCVTFGLQSPFIPEGRYRMAAQTGQSSILAKLGNSAREVAAKHATVEPEIPNMGLPAGIENAVAQVVDCKFGTVEPGKRSPGATYFMAQAIVKSPDIFKSKEYPQGIKISGRRTMLYKEVADVKGVVNEKNMEWAQDQLKMLVGKGADPKMFLLDNMEATAALIREAGKHKDPSKRLHTLFRTWKGDKQDVKLHEGKWFLCNLTEDGNVKNVVTIKGARQGPYPSERAARAANKYAGNEAMVNTQWCGVTQYVAPSVNGQVGGVVDESGSAANAGTDLPTGDEPATAEEFNEFQEQGEAVGTTEQDESPQEEDLDTLAKEAYGSPELQNRILQLALAVGIDEATVNSPQNTWEDVIALIREARQGTDSSDQVGQEEPWVPVKGEVCYYYPKQANGKPVLGKNKKPLRTEVVIHGTDKRLAVASLQDNVTKKVILGADKKPLMVSWDDLAVD